MLEVAYVCPLELNDAVPTPSILIYRFRKSPMDFKWWRDEAQGRKNKRGGMKIKQGQDEDLDWISRVELRI